MAKHIHIHLAPTRTADRKVKDASFPANVEHKGKKYIKTGKIGKSLANNEETAEYEAVNAEGKRTSERLWLSASGKKTEDATNPEIQRLERRLKELQTAVKGIEKEKAEWVRRKFDTAELDQDLKAYAPEIKELEKKLERLYVAARDAATKDAVGTYFVATSFGNPTAWKSAISKHYPNVTYFNGPRNGLIAKVGKIEVGRWEGPQGSVHPNEMDATKDAILRR